MKKKYFTIAVVILFIIGFYFYNKKNDSSLDNAYHKEEKNQKNMVVRNQSFLVQEERVKEDTKDIIKKDSTNNFKDNVLNNLNSILLGNSNNTGFINNNLSKLFECEECLKKIIMILTNEEINSSIVEKISNGISFFNNKESVIFLLESLALNYELENKINGEIIQNSFFNFSSEEVALLFTTILFKDKQSLFINDLPINVQYAMEKTINNVANRENISSHLFTLYENSSEELKDKIINFNYPETNAMIALDAYNNGDNDVYKNILQNLVKKDNEDVINGLMFLARKIDSSSLNEVTKIAIQWNQTNSSQRSIEIAEDYLSRSDATSQERIIALALLSNDNGENNKKALSKALDYEEDGDVINSIESSFDREL
jgi:hypothetical protein